MKAKKYTRETIADLGSEKRSNFDNFVVGDTIAVAQRIKEGDKERLQAFEGVVIAIRNQGVSSTFTVRKMGANAVAVERIFPFHAPFIDSVKFIRKGKVRRAKLYYIRERVGKAARVKEHILTKEQKEQKGQKEQGQASE